MKLLETELCDHLTERRGSKFHVSFQVRHETHEEGQRTRWPKLSDYNKKEEKNIPKTLNDKNAQASPKKIFINFFHTFFKKFH